MKLPRNFIAAGNNYSTLTNYIPAPYFRKSFSLEYIPNTANLLICGLGFYELSINGEKITKGALAPYTSNPDHIIYYDQYDIVSRLIKGGNVIGICLGNGIQNNPSGQMWDFDKALYRGAPQVAMELRMETESGTIIITTDESFKTADSPIYYDDLRSGEYYDARKESSGWNCPSYDDRHWKNAIIAPMPRGEGRVCEAEPIVVKQELPPISVSPIDDGYLYDFGINSAGVCRLLIKGDEGQTITLYYGEWLEDGRLNRKNIS